MQLSGITDGDAVFLHRQSSYAKEQAKGQPSTNYYMPSPSDRSDNITMVKFEYHERIVKHACLLLNGGAVFLHWQSSYTNEHAKSQAATQ